MILEIGAIVGFLILLGAVAFAARVAWVRTPQLAPTVRAFSVIDALKSFFTSLFYKQAEPVQENKNRQNTKESSIIFIQEPSKTEKNGQIKKEIFPDHLRKLNVNALKADRSYFNSLAARHLRGDEDVLRRNVQASKLFIASRPYPVKQGSPHAVSKPIPIPRQQQSFR